MYKTEPVKSIFLELLNSYSIEYILLSEFFAAVNGNVDNKYNIMKIIKKIIQKAIV